MKVLLYRGGKPGVVATTPGEHPPEVEISDLLGGAVTVTPLTERLMLATLEDAPRLRLPFQYVATSIIPSVRPPEPEPVPGDAVVFAAEGQEIRKVNITPADQDLFVASLLFAVAGKDARVVDITDADRGLILAEGLMKPLEL